MGKYVFKYRGNGASPESAKEKLEEWQNLTVIQESENELVISGPSAEVKNFRRELDGWIFSVLTSIPRPKTGPARHSKVRHIEG